MNKDNLVFRKANIEDIDEIKAMAREIGIKNYIPFLGAENVNDFIDSGACDKQIDELFKKMTVCEHDGKIIGLVGFWDDLVHILQVKYSHQREGIGRLLLSYAETELFKNNSVIRLETFDDNVQAKSFYKKNGWQIIGKEYSDYIKGYVVKLNKKRPEEQC